MGEGLRAAQGSEDPRTRDSAVALHLAWILFLRRARELALSPPLEATLQIPVPPGYLLSSLPAWSKQGLFCLITCCISSAYNIAGHSRLSIYSCQFDLETRLISNVYDGEL